MNAFTLGYLEAAIWSSTDETGEPLDHNYGIDDFAPETLAKAIEDCDKFLAENIDDVIYRLEEAGNDFWLSRNRHGAGYFDGDWADVGDKLQSAAVAFGEVYIYVGDDNLIYS